MLLLQAGRLPDPLSSQLGGTRRHEMTELPSIAWERYTSDVESVLALLGSTSAGPGQSTRLKQKRRLMNDIRSAPRTNSTTTAAWPASSSSSSSCSGVLGNNTTTCGAGSCSCCSGGSDSGVADCGSSVFGNTTTCHDSSSNYPASSSGSGLCSSRPIKHQHPASNFNQPFSASSSSSSIFGNTTTCNSYPASSSSSSSGKPRPATFNQPWSTEEQLRLEQLLRKHPPERFESRRFAKIASELPGRTTQQVTSRVQKYFIKLAKAGLPVPGRMPNLAAHGGRWFSGRCHGHHGRNHFYYPASTFLASYAPPVYMSDDDGDYDDGHCGSERNGTVLSTVAGTNRSNIVPGNNGDVDDDDDDDDDDVPESLRNTEEYQHQQLKTLTRLRKHMANNHHSAVDNNDRSLFQNNDQSIDGQTRALSQQSHIDWDYTSRSTGVSSYLDPNYMPAL